MPRTKKIEAETTSGDLPKKLVISPIPVEYQTEALNDMARKLNEVIAHLNES